MTTRRPVSEFQRPPPCAAASLPVTVPPFQVTCAAPVRCSAPPLPGMSPVLLSLMSTSARSTVPAAVSRPPPARSDRFFVIVVSWTETVPPTSSRPPPEPAAPVARLPTRRTSETVIVPPSLKSPPPPWSASTPVARLRATRVPVTLIWPSAEFQRPPPSAEARFLRTRLPSTTTAPAPVRCSAPPLPGAAPVRLPRSTESVTVVTPALASMPPPARSARLRSMRVPTTDTLPPSFMIAPPLAPSPRARLPTRRESTTSSVAPVARMAPPDSPSGARPPRSVRSSTRSVTSVTTSRMRSLPRARICLPLPSSTSASVISREPLRRVMLRPSRMVSSPVAWLALATAARSWDSVFTVNVAACAGAGTATRPVASTPSAPAVRADRPGRGVGVDISSSSGGTSADEYGAHAGRVHRAGQSPRRGTPPERRSAPVREDRGAS